MSNDPIIQIPLNIIPDQPQQETDTSRPSVAIITRYGLLLILAVLARVVPFSKTVDSANGVQVTDTWPSLTHFAFGEDPDMRTETHKNGEIWRGPIQRGKRTGNWTRSHNGKVKRLIIKNGKAQ